MVRRKESAALGEQGVVMLLHRAAAGADALTSASRRAEDDTCDAVIQQFT